MTALRRTSAGLAAVLAGLAAWAAWIEPRRLVLRRVTLRLPRWPRALDGLRVALVSDLHAGSPQVAEHACGAWHRQRRLLARRIAIPEYEIEPGAVLGLREPEFVSGIDDVDNELTFNPIVADAQIEVAEGRGVGCCERGRQQQRQEQQNLLRQADSLSDNIRRLCGSTTMSL